MNNHNMESELQKGGRKIISALKSSIQDVSGKFSKLFNSSGSADIALDRITVLKRHIEVITETIAKLVKSEQFAGITGNAAVYTAHTKLAATTLSEINTAAVLISTLPAEVGTEYETIYKLGFIQNMMSTHLDLDSRGASFNKTMTSNPMSQIEKDGTRPLFLFISGFTFAHIVSYARRNPTQCTVITNMIIRAYVAISTVCREIYDMYHEPLIDKHVFMSTITEMVDILESNPAVSKKFPHVFGIIHARLPVLSDNIGAYYKKMKQLKTQDITVLLTLFIEDLRKVAKADSLKKKQVAPGVPNTVIMGELVRFANFLQNAISNMSKKTGSKIISLSDIMSQVSAAVDTADTAEAEGKLPIRISSESTIEITEPGGKVHQFRVDDDDEVDEVDEVVEDMAPTVVGDRSEIEHKTPGRRITPK